MLFGFPLIIANPAENASSFPENCKINISYTKWCAPLDPLIYEGGARRAGGVRIFALQIFGKSHFSVKSGHPLRPGGSGLCPNPPGHLPHKWGRQGFFDTLKARSANADRAFSIFLLMQIRYIALRFDMIEIPSRPAGHIECGAHIEGEAYIENPARGFISTIKLP